MPRRGFTLIELLVALCVMAVLVAILFPAYSSIRRSQKIKRVEATVQALASGIEAYQNDFGVFPPASAAADPNRGNRSLVYFLKLGEAAKGKSAPYLPSAFYNQSLQIERDLLLDEWDRPFIYFDTSAMQTGIQHTYDILGIALVEPAKGATGYYNIGRFQLWSCGPNERNDGGRNLHTREADDLANFVPE